MSREEMVVQYHLDQDGHTVVTPLDEGNQPRLSSSFILEEDLSATTRWSLTPAHDLKLTLEGAEGVSKELILKGEIVAVEPERFSFSFGFQDREGRRHIRMLQFKGVWAADEQNRITFRVARRTGAQDTLTLDGLWEVGDNHEILYRYQRKDLKSGAIEQHSLTFKGRWQMNERDTLSYWLLADSSSGFRFKVMLTDTRIVAGVGAIQFQVGIDVGARHLPHVQDITLFGKWKVGSDFSVSFAITYEEGEIDEWRFEATYAVASKTEISFSLRGKGGEFLGVEVLFSKKILQGDGEIYVKLRETIGETRVEGGVRFLWGVVGSALILTSAAWGAEPGLAPTKPKPAKIKLSQSQFDFGQVREGMKVKHVYEMRNAGGKDLSITEVATTCGCTTALLDKAVVPPGGAARLEVVFSTERRTGLQTKIISFRTNDPENPKVDLTLKGAVQPLLASEPEFFYFLIGDEEVTQEAQTHHFTNSRFALVGASSSSPFLVVTPKTVFGTPGHIQKFSVTLKKGYPNVSLFEKVALFTNDPMQPVVWVAVGGRRK